MKGELSGVVGRVFAGVADPVGSGFAASLARPGSVGAGEGACSCGPNAQFATRTNASPVSPVWRSFEASTRPAYRRYSQTPRWKRGMISPLHEWPPTGGSHGKPHRTTEILSHARRRGGLAARGAGAAVGVAGDRVSHARIGRVVVAPCGR